jgi:hypothetical protein
LAVELAGSINRRPLVLISSLAIIISLGGPVLAATKPNKKNKQSQNNAANQPAANQQEFNQQGGNQAANNQNAAFNQQANANSTGNNAQQNATQQNAVDQQMGMQQEAPLNQQSAANEQGTEPEDGDDDAEDSNPSQGDQAFFYDARRNPHPRYPSSHATKRLILTFKKPKEEQLNICVKEFRSAADTSTNADSMVQTMRLMTAAVSKNINFYHWCFYHYVSALDWKLEEDSLGLQLQDKMTIFTKNMKGLWLLARSLDLAAKTNIYFDFIKFRYVELSSTHFGRNLEVISPPLGDPRWIEPTKYFRPAGAF